MRKTASLPDHVLTIIRDKGTEKPFTGAYEKLAVPGSYLCRQCGHALFRADSKFISQCGWPSFDADITHAVKQQLDADGRRTEIVCAYCDAHLGHVFHGEGYTQKNTRHCVNSLSVDFVPDENIIETEEAIVAAGCFWGVEYFFKKLPGVLKTEVGYIGGNKKLPTYQEVCSGNTGHVEALRIIYDPKKINYENIIKYFFEIHDPIQTDGQGPDRGSQYLSKIFYYDETQKTIAYHVMALLQQQGLTVATQLSPVSAFWSAEEYHQDYYTKVNKEPYCHRYTKRF